MNKFVYFIKATVAFGCACLISFGLLAHDALALGQFSKNCADTDISGSVLTSTCYRADGSTLNTSSLDLNPYIENVDGFLVWQPSNFIETCSFTTIIGSSTLVTNCKSRDQALQHTEIDLNEHIANINGTLTYQ